MIMEQQQRPPAPASVDEAKRLVLGGTLDAANPLAALRGNALVWSDVFGRVEEHERFLASHVEPTPDALKVVEG